MISTPAPVAVVANGGQSDTLKSDSSHASLLSEQAVAKVVPAAKSEVPASDKSTGLSASTQLGLSPTVAPDKGLIAKAEKPENGFKVDGTTPGIVQPISTSVPPGGEISIGNKPSSASSEYSISTESLILPEKSTPPPSCVTELKMDAMPSSFGLLDQPSINVPGSGNTSVGQSSEITIITRPQVPAVMFNGHPIGKDSAEDSIGLRSSRYQDSTLAVGGKWFKMVNKIWIDQDFTANSDLPIVKVKMKSAEGQDLITKNPGLRPFLQLRRQVIVVYEGKVYVTY